MEKGWQAHQLRVRYAETDQMGVVYHVNYMNWFEVGRTEWIRSLGIQYRSLEEQGLLLPVVEANIQYQRPARYDDEIAVYTRLDSWTSVRLEFQYEIRRAALSEGLHEEPTGELLVTGSTKHVWVNRQWRPARIDKASPELFQLLERCGRKGDR